MATEDATGAPPEKSPIPNPLLDRYLAGLDGFQPEDQAVLEAGEPKPGTLNLASRREAFARAQEHQDNELLAKELPLIATRVQESLQRQATQKEVHLSPSVGNRIDLAYERKVAADSLQVLRGETQLAPGEAEDMHIRLALSLIAHYIDPSDQRYKMILDQERPGGFVEARHYDSPELTEDRRELVFKGVRELDEVEVQRRGWLSEQQSQAAKVYEALSRRFPVKNFSERPLSFWAQRVDPTYYVQRAQAEALNLL